MKKITYLFLLVVIVSCKQETSSVSGSTEALEQTINKSALIETFKYVPNSKPIVSVHRGGKSIKNYPENCLETLVYVNDSIKAIYEIDVAKTKDNVLVLMHDKSINRTTTGDGLITNYTYNELQDFSLVDDFGNQTEFKIPLFKEVLQWAKTNNVVLTVDIKRSVATKDVVNAIKGFKAENQCIIITYDLKQAQTAYKLAPELLLSVSARNFKELDWLIHSGIPTKNMLAFTGTRFSSDSLYIKLHGYGIKTILGTLGNLDKQAQTKGDALYKRWADKGIDIIATDRPFAVAKVLELEK